MSPDFPTLTLLIFLPLCGSLLLCALWRNAAVARPLALAIAAAEFVLASWTCTVTSLTGLPGTPRGFFLFEDAVSREI